MTDIRSKKTDSDYLRNDQYKNADNLAARAQLHARFSTNKYGWQRWVFDQFDPNMPPHAHIIEFGCGPGWGWAQLGERVPADWEVTLSDFSAGMLEDCKKNLAASTHPYQFEVIDIQSIPYPDASFDVIIANHMLYHVPNLRQALAELKRVLKPTGKLYTATNGVDHMRELYELAVRFDPTLNYWEGFSAARSFELDNGRDLLSEFFPKVDLRRYEDAIVATEAEPVVAYILSGPGQSMIQGEKLDALRVFVQHEIDTKGAVRITKDSGMLISSFR